MLLKARPITWSFIRYGLQRWQQANRCCSGFVLKEEGKWTESITNQHLLEIEQNWRDKVEAENKCRKETSGQKYYVLSMFPYPSGKLHMGHVRVYVISDLMARYHRMLGHKVIHPMGWDAFGLPAENAAIQRNLDPKEWTHSNIETMKSQMNKLLCSFDWDREVVTCDPSYYRWTQYIFLKMFERGLVYQKEAEVNWDPVDKTVLADEQIDDKGCSWRSGAVVEKRFLNQWYIRTTQYSQSLLDGLDTVSSNLWRDVIQLQKNWIGECTGSMLDFKLLNNSTETGEVISVFTEYPECIHGVSFIALSWLHAYNSTKYHKIQDDANESVDRQLTLEAVHPISLRRLPVLVAVGLADKFKTHDSHMGIPSVSLEDREIAERNGIFWVNVLDGKEGEETLINSGQLDSLSRSQARQAVMDHAKEAGFGGYPVSSSLRDWLISRQRYWGTPIPIIHCEKCKAVPVPFEDLPVILPEQSGQGSQASAELDNKLSDDKIKSPLLNNKEWLEVICPKCGGPATRETDTMDTFVDSSWYFYRYLDSTNQNVPFTREQADANMPVDLYIGGKEHAYMHLYYARFFSHFLCDIGLSGCREPFETLLTQGMVKADSYTLKKTGVYVPPSEVQKTVGNGYIHIPTGEAVSHHYEKMSKSKYNGVDPEDLLREYGIDMTRLCILSNVAPKSDRVWNTNVYLGVHRWLNRVWSLVRILVLRKGDSTSTLEDVDLHQHEKSIRQTRNNYVMEIRHHLDSTFLINVALSRMHEISRELKKVPVRVAQCSREYERAVADLVIMIAPFVPLFSSEMWSLLQQTMVYNKPNYDLTSTVLEQSFPEPDSNADVTVDVLCNGVWIGKLDVEYSTMDQLTEERAVQLAGQESFYQSTINTCRVVNSSLTVIPRLRAEIDVSVPELEEQMKKLKAEKVKEFKQKKKEKKEKKESEIASV